MSQQKPSKHQAAPLEEQEGSASITKKTEHCLEKQDFPLLPHKQFSLSQTLQGKRVKSWKVPHALEKQCRQESHDAPRCFKKRVIKKELSTVEASRPGSFHCQQSGGDAIAGVAPL